VEVLHGEEPVQGDNHLGLRLASPGRRVRLVAVHLEWETPSGQRGSRAQRLRLSGGAPGYFELPYHLEEAGAHRASLRLYDLERGGMVGQVKELPLYARPRWELVQDRSYYTGERQIRFRLRLNRQEQRGRRAAVRLRAGKDVLEVMELDLTTGQAEGAFAAAHLPAGSYWLEAFLHGAEGDADSLRVQVLKLAPAKREVKIDLFSQALLVDGEPFFPIGLYWLREEILGEVRRLHFNSGDYYYKLQGEEIASLMAAASRAEVHILLELSDFIRHRQEPDYAAIRATIERYRRHPALLAWYLIDEPDETKVDPEHARQAYALIRELDPYHPVYLVNNRPHAYAAYAGASDILAIDVYPVPRHPLSRVRDYMKEARWASLGRQPVWLVAQAFGGVEHWPRAPTAAELRNMVYQGLVQGARGVLFYRYVQESERHIQPPPLWGEVRTLAAELKALAPVLVQPEHRGLSGGEVEVALKKHGNALYVLAVNVEKTSRRLRLSLAGLPPPGRAERVYGQGSPRLRGGVLEAELGPLGTAVYRVEPAGI
jgi:hypothetical protein